MDAQPVSSAALVRLITTPDLEGIKARMCQGKIGFSGRQEAKKKAKHVLRHGCDPSHVYQCPFCGRWHLSTHYVRGDKAFYNNLHAQVTASLALLTALDKEIEEREIQENHDGHNL